MTPTEFKAWFDGFCEGLDGAPSPEQWAKVKEKVAHVRDVNWTTPITPHVPSVPGYDPNLPWWKGPISCGGIALTEKADTWVVGGDGSIRHYETH